ncbi:lytic transglycosylase domain-containing protein [Alkalihalophilus lindianensis]|uniref:Lytic transglycosylase domain-containing protein n=1 Tax=Alkalihalophilus lindianensis TaxID=1630542 RepID=A0ABU3X8W8_9BACI|nr:lytic transglycosylase domain-containing protein [Alkalihalophilus lindianensis]MDV2683748.1 lytic transglycosylase domain-containing protein [Alkalihalophilus lindianensis]
MRKFLMFLFFTAFIVLIVAVWSFEKNDQVKQITYKTLIGQHHIPEKYLPIYKEAAEEYEVPWELLASVHRVETIFSTMDPLISPVGAVGHFQFMPRTWVGWSYPGGDLGQIEDEIDITDIDLIEEHRGYGVDATGNGKADPFDLYDSAYSAARYLADHGASEGDYERALFAYNQSNEYVSQVMKFFDSYNDHYELVSLPFAYD